MNLLSTKSIDTMIYFIRGERVMIDSDLAELYEVTTGNFNKAISRNLDRFPADFMFELTLHEFEQIDPKRKHGGRRTPPRVFTESGIAMLSGVLNSKRAVNVNISIMRTFTKLRRLLHSDQSLIDKVNQIEKGSDKLFKVIFERLDTLEVNTTILPEKRKKIQLK